LTGGSTIAPDERLSALGFRLSASGPGALDA
jgi:hypothetical protein